MSEEQQQDGLLQIRYLPLRQLVPYAQNARKHPPSQITKLKDSLLEYGWAAPMLIADGEMIAGHGRLESALALAREGKAIPRNPDPWVGPTVDLSHLTPRQRRGYVLMDNKSALGAAWDEDILAMELGSLAEDGMDLSLTGFSFKDIDKLLASDPLDFKPDEPKLAEKAHTCPACGHHWTEGEERDAAPKKPKSPR